MGRRFSRATKALVVLVTVMALVVMPVPQVASAGDVRAVVDLVLLPSSQTVDNIGDIFDVSIEAQCNGQDVSGVAAFVDFDPDYLEVKSVTPGTTLPTVLQNTYDNNAGTIDYQAGKLGAPFPSDTFTVATISFKALNSTANTPINFHTTSPRETNADFGGESKLRNLTGATVTASNISSHGQGLPSRPEPGVTNVSNMITDEGVFTGAAIAQTEDGLCKIMIDKGTIALTRDKKPLSEITMTELEALPAPAPGPYAIGPTYNLGPDGATFDPAITVAITYDPAEIPEAIVEQDLVIARRDANTGEWLELVSTAEPGTNTVMASVEHFTPFTILGYEAVIEPDAFGVSSLNISPPEVNIGETVTISLSVTNSSSKASTYKVTLKINGLPEASKHVRVDAGSSEKVSFTTLKDIVGNYSVHVNGLTASFKVNKNAGPTPTERPIKWPILWGVIGGVVVVGLLMLLIIRRKPY